MPTPLPRHNLVLNQGINCGAVRHPQQCLSETHHRNPLVGGEPVLGEERFKQVG